MAADADDEAGQFSGTYKYIRRYLYIYIFTLTNIYIYMAYIYIYYIYIYHIKLAATAGHVPGVKEMPAYGRASPSMWCPLPCLVRAAYGQRNYIAALAHGRRSCIAWSHMGRASSDLCARLRAAHHINLLLAYGQRRPRPLRSPTGGAGWRHHARLWAAQQHGARLGACAWLLNMLGADLHGGGPWCAARRSRRQRLSRSQAVCLLCELHSKERGSHGAKRSAFPHHRRMWLWHVPSTFDGRAAAIHWQSSLTTEDKRRAWATGAGTRLQNRKRQHVDVSHVYANAAIGELCERQHALLLFLRHCLRRNCIARRPGAERNRKI